MADPELDRLIALVECDFTNPETYLALGAHLREHGDPRGELTEIMHARADGAEASDRERALIKAVGPDGPWDARLGWRRGWAAEAELFLGDGDTRALRNFLAHPSLRFVQNLDLHAGVENEDDDTSYLVPVLAEARRACLRHLYIDQIIYDGHDDPPRDAIDFTALWPQTPALAELFATARTITLGAAAPTALEEVSLDGQVRGADLAALIVASPKLRSLRVVDLIEPAPFWAALARAPHLAQATRFSIAGEPLDDTAAECILAAADVLAKIPSLQLPFVSGAAGAAVRARLPFATFAEPRDPGRYEPVSPDDDDE
jgi:hypothetical protein